MKRVTCISTLLSFLLSSLFSLAQVNMIPECKPQFTKSAEIFMEKSIKSQTKAIIWSVDFEETTPVWSTALDPVGMPAWTIVNQNSYPTILGDYDGWYLNPLGDYSLTGNGEEHASEGHWALLNVIGHALPGGTGIDPPVIGESSIRFDNINLAAVNNPKLEWYQMLRAFNGNWFDCSVDVSVNGGTTWTVYPVNVAVATNDYAPIFQDLAIPAAANEANVSIRFRWAQDRTATSGFALVGYGWQLDDISIVENAQYDMKMVDARMNFFSYIDYTAEYQENLFHYSSHFGHIPVAQIGSENAYMWFNFIIENKGVQTVTPTVKVTVTNPLDGISFEQELVGVSMNSGRIDTLDLTETAFQLNPAYIGNYEVSYEVFMAGHTDGNLQDNTFASEFNVTNDLYARDLDNINGRFGLSGYTNMGISEEIIATDYQFVEDTEIFSGDVFINNITTPGTSFQMQLYTYNEFNNAWEVFAESTIYTVEESDLGTWMHCTWEDASFLTVNTESLTTTIRAGIKTYYNSDGEDFYIGTDNSTSYGSFASFCYFKSGADWGWYYGMTDKALAIRLNTSEDLCNTVTTIINQGFCAGSSYNFFGTELTEANTYYHTLVNPITGCDSIIKLNLTKHPIYFIEETAEICQGDSYFWEGTNYSTSGVYTANHTSSNGCDSIHELTLIINPVYNFSETHNMCQGNVYSWCGTNYSTSGVYTANYTTTHGCDSIYELTLTVNPTYEFVTTQSICDGESYEWRGNDYTEANTYTETYHTQISGCDSIYKLILTINPLPQQVVVLRNPTNGILTQGNYGQIKLSTSITGTVYWVTMGESLYTSEIAGNGNILSLGTSFIAGNYDVWARNTFGCVINLGSTSFVDGADNNKIIASVSFGTPATNFSVGEVLVTLYKASIDNENNPVVNLEDQVLLDSNGKAIFDNISDGDYYLGSSIVNPANYNVASHTYYQAAITHEEATSISTTGNTIFNAQIHHSKLEGGQGSNTAGGIVGILSGTETIIPEANMAVILRNESLGQIIDVCLTNQNGEFNFEIIPNNTNIKMYVSSFEHQQWIPYTLHTSSDQHYTVNFIIDGYSVYPSDYTRSGDESLNFETQIYPNPAQNTIYILSPDEISEVAITDINGRTILKNGANVNSIDISELSDGLYFVKITTASGIVVKKFVKQ